MLAECFAFKLKSQHALEIYDYVLDGYKRLFGDYNTV